MNGDAIHTNRPLRFSIVTGTALAFALLLPGIKTESAQAKQSAVAVDAPALAKARSHEGRRHWYQFGRASWYGQDFQGLPTASGEAYDMHSMTCAHRNLPLGSLVRVTNLRNHRSIVVRVNDRGPVPKTRVVDLSYGAAQKLGFAQRGLTNVRLDLVDAKPTAAEIAQLTYPEMSGRR